MSGCNPGNARLIRRYLDDLRRVEGLQPVTIDHTLRAIAEFEQFTGGRDFRLFNRKLAIAYQEELLTRLETSRGSLATVHSKLMRVGKFHRWLAQEGGLRNIRMSDVACFSLSRLDQTRARQRIEKPTPSMEQVLSAIKAMPASTDLQLRDQAAMALLAMTGIRGTALTSLQLKHVHSDGLGITQDGTEVKTKGGKNIVSYFVALDRALIEIFSGYFAHLQNQLGFDDCDPLFPATLKQSENGVLQARALSRLPWKTTDALRYLCHKAFLAMGSKGFSPHAIRRTLIREVQRRSATPEQFMAHCQNVGHADPGVTFRNYGGIPLERQAELMADLGSTPAATPAHEDFLRDLAKLLERHRPSQPRRGA